MKVGDLVKYRSWKIGDDDPKSLPIERRGWDTFGVILEIGDWKVGETVAPGEGLIVYTLKGEFCEWRSKDASVISETESISYCRQRSSNKPINSNISNY